MTEPRSGQSAVIYRLSDRVRLGASRPRLGPAEAPRAEQRPLITTGAWYHEEAIREAERDRKN